MTNPVEPVEGKVKLTELAERLAAATGPGRELDAMIWCEISENRHWIDDRYTIYGKSRDNPSSTVRIGYIDPGARQRNFSAATDFPTYTASIDAALALVERLLPDWGSAILLWSAGGKYPVFRMERSYPTNLEVAAEGHTRPLAILAALVGALSKAEGPNP